MSELDRGHPLQQRYYRNVRNAFIAAMVIHSLIFALTPPYMARPLRMAPDPLRWVEAQGPSVRAAAPSETSPAAPRTAAPRPPEGVVVGALIRTEPAATTQASSAPAPVAASTASTSTEGAGAVNRYGEEPGPPVFYAYDEPPRVRHRVEPEYPAAARAQGAEGTVVIHVNVDPQGQILRAWVATASAPEILIDAALDAVYQFEFLPGAQRGVNVPCTVAIPFHFSLKQVLQLSEGG